MKEQLQKYIEMNVFDKEQLYEIKKGLNQKLDISIYANSKFEGIQMFYIRESLLKGFNVKELIDKVDYEILPLLADLNTLGLDINKYINKDEKSLKSLKSRTLNKKVKEILNSKGFDSKDFDKNYIEVIKESILEGIDLTPYISKDFNHHQLIQIRDGIRQGFNVSVYAKPKFNEKQMFYIKCGLKEGLDVSIYAKEYFNGEQMWEIKSGLKDNLNVSLYAYKEFNFTQMWNIKKSLLEGRFKRSHYFDTRIIDNKITYIPKDF